MSREMSGRSVSLIQLYAKRMQVRIPFFGWLLELVDLPKVGEILFVAANQAQCACYPR